jgi:hypothetical protein
MAIGTLNPLLPRPGASSDRSSQLTLGLFRSPSPPPQYDNHGRRVNTREYRYRKRLEDERHKLIEKAMKTIPNYHPPQDYRRPTKTQEKVYVPVNDYPEINFSEIANPLTFLTTLCPLFVQDLARSAVALRQTPYRSWTYLHHLPVCSNLVTCTNT